MCKFRPLSTRDQRVCLGEVLLTLYSPIDPLPFPSVTHPSKTSREGDLVLPHYTVLSLPEVQSSPFPLLLRGID